MTSQKTDPFKQVKRESLFTRWWNSRNFIQQRLIRFCMIMIVMILCFPLYYLGFFGTMEGPLHPAHLGEQLSNIGVTKTRMLVFFMSMAAISVSWNWIYNLISILIGSRLTCKREMDDEGTICGASVKRNKIVHKKTGGMTNQYVCIHGHKRPDAHFHSVKKSAFSHTLWILSVAFSLIVFFES